MAGRRGNSEGTITKRADGRWEARVTLPAGKRKSFYGQTRREVERKLSAARRDLEQGLPVLDERQTVEQYLRTWLETIKHEIRPSSWRIYEIFVRVHLLPAIGNIRLARLTPQQIQLAYTSMLGKDLSPTTVHHIHEMLHRALNDALKLGLVQRNVSSVVKAPRRAKREMQTLNQEQVRRFLEVVQGDRFEALYILALSTGMREGELLGLRWQDMDLDKTTIQLQVGLQRSGNKFVVAEPKTDHSRRCIALAKNAVDALRAHKVRQIEERLALGEAWDSSYDLVFPNSIGRPMQPSDIGQGQFIKHLARAGLPRIRFHDLRHTVATLLLEQGINPKVVSEMLGHSSVSITLGVYAHVTPHMQQAAVMAIDAILGA